MKMKYYFVIAYVLFVIILGISINNILVPPKLGKIASLTNWLKIEYNSYKM